jgi:predicted SprT family Zn-dependent metalloprotease
MITTFRQLWFDFTQAEKNTAATGRVVLPPPKRAAPPPPPGTEQHRHASGRDHALEAVCRALLLTLGMTAPAGKVRVHWNPRLRSTAGYASYPAWRIELNPRLREFDGQTERTLRHELAHLVAYQRAGHRRIEPHGAHWRRACADLGIAGERAHHHLPLPRNQVRRNFTYTCAGCGAVVRRVRKFRRHSACKSCCARHGDGSYDPRFKFELVRMAAADG